MRDKCNELSDIFMQRGAWYITREEVLELQQENTAVKGKIIEKFYGLTVVATVFFVLCATLTYKATIPKIGFIGSVNQVGEVTRLAPTMNKQVTAKDAYLFVTDKTQQIRTIFFESYWKDLVAQEPYFTKTAYDSYLKTLSDSGTLNGVVTEFLNITATLAPTQRINAFRAFEEESAYWYVKVSLILRKEQQSGEDDFFKEEYLVKAKEVTRSESKFGLKIASIERY